ncbi:hypothetical protein CTRI78_v000172 [Colletotrichum trifolii]|uniref:2EXR domain-containing protein n=1 Tax=Colletotrichum trifolii TaxID=5466 RepID=A0A4R8RVR8_COLTR|nr:hypothetical protein CTRI78_v000172 [Colletotrichum trifolii]
MGSLAKGIRSRIWEYALKNEINVMKTFELRQQNGFTRAIPATAHVCKESRTVFLANFSRIIEDYHWSFLDSPRVGWKQDGYVYIHFPTRFITMGEKCFKYGTVEIEGPRIGPEVRLDGGRLWIHDWWFNEDRDISDLERRAAHPQPRPAFLTRPDLHEVYWSSMRLEYDLWGWDYDCLGYHFHYHAPSDVLYITDIDRDDFEYGQWINRMNGMPQPIEVYDILAFVCRVTIQHDPDPEDDVDGFAYYMEFKPPSTNDDSSPSTGNGTPSTMNNDPFPSNDDDSSSSSCTMVGDSSISMGDGSCTSVDSDSITDDDDPFPSPDEAPENARIIWELVSGMLNERIPAISEQT